MNIGEFVREIYVEPLELPQPLQQSVPAAPQVETPEVEVPV